MQETHQPPQRQEQQPRLPHRPQRQEGHLSRQLPMEASPTRSIASRRRRQLFQTLTARATALADVRPIATRLRQRVMAGTLNAVPAQGPRARRRGPPFRSAPPRRCSMMRSRRSRLNKPIQRLLQRPMAAIIYIRVTARQFLQVGLCHQHAWARIRVVAIIIAASPCRTRTVWMPIAAAAAAPPIAGARCIAAS